MVKRRKDSKGRVLRNGETQRTDGKYMFRYTDYDGSRKTIYSWRLIESDKDPAGKQSKGSLRELEKIISKDLEDGIRTSDGDKTSVNKLFESFLELRTDLKPTTRSNYVCLYNKHVRDDIGKRPLGSVKHSDVYKYYQSLLNDRELKTATVQVINSILCQMFNIAVQDDMIRKSPAEGVISELIKRAGNDKSKRHALTIGQQSTLIDYIYGDPKYKSYGTLFTVLIGTGMRIGEALGLTWDDVDFKNNIISVNHSINYKPTDSSGYEYHVTSTKTAAGNRKIPMFQDVRKALLAEKRKRKNPKNEPFVVDGYKGFVFLNSSGKVFTPAFVFDVIQNIVTDCNRTEAFKAERENRKPELIPKISAHIFRHTFCTRLCENETNIKVVQDIMGHKNIRTTMDVYNEATAEAKMLSFANLEGKIKLR